MSDRRLGQSELEDLSAYVDGELPPDRAAEVERLIASDAAWRRACEQIRATDDLLDAYTVPEPPAGLADRIIQAALREARGRSLVVRVLRIAAPVAAAAAIILAVARHSNPPPPPPPPTEVDRLVQDNLDFFQDYDVVANFETLQAIDRLEGQTNGT